MVDKQKKIKVEDSKEYLTMVDEEMPLISSNTGTTIKLTITKDHLIVLLDIASLAVSRRDEDDISNNFLFKFEDDILSILSTDKISISKIQTKQIEVTPNKPFAFTLKGTKIQGLLSTLKKVDTINLEFNQKELSVVLNGKYDLPSREPADFPFFDTEIEKAEEISNVEISRFTDSLSYIKGFIGTDIQGRPELTSAPILEGKIISSNGKTLGVYESDVFKAEGFEVPYNVITNVQRFIKQVGQKELELAELLDPVETTMKVVEDQTSNQVDLSTIIEQTEQEMEGVVALKTKLSGVTSKEPAITLMKSDNYFLLASKDKTMFYGYRKSDYKFPKKMLEKHLDEEYDESIMVSRNDLLDVIQRLSFCLNENSSRMSFSLEGQDDATKLVLSVLGSHNRESKEELPVKRLVGSEEDISFDLTYLHLQKILPLYASPEIFIGIKKEKNIRLIDNMDSTVKLSGMVSFIRKRGNE